MTNKVPEFVCSGSIQTTRAWVVANEQAQRVAAGGLARMSKKKLAALAKRMKGETAAETA